MRRYLPHKSSVLSALLVAIGVGPAATALTVQRSLSPAGLPYPNADRLVTLLVGGKSWSPGMLEAVSRLPIFEGVAGIQERSAVIDLGDGPSVVRLDSVSAAYFELLGARPIRGRAFDATEDRRNGTSAIALISYQMWRSRLAASPEIIGQRLSIDGRPHEIIGVLPQGFAGLVGRTDVWTPLGSARWLGGDTGPERPTSRWFEMFARRRPDLDRQETERQFGVQARAAIAGIPGGERLVSSTTRLAIVPLADARVPPVFTPAARVLTLAVGMIVILVIVNVTGLQLLRAEERRRELAIRLAIGASAGHVVTAALREAAWIALAGAAGALALRPLLLTALTAIQPASSSFGIVTSELLTPAAWHIDLTLSGFVLAVAALSVAPIALVIALKARRLRVEWALRATTPIGGGLTRIWDLRGVLIAVQAGLTCAVLCGGALLVRSTSALISRDRGYRADDVVTARLALPTRYDGPGAARAYDQIVERLLQSGGVASASVSNCAPGGGRCRQTNLARVDGRTLEPSTQPTVGVHYVTPGHFETINVHVARGRPITTGDSVAAPPVVVISEWLAARLWPGADPIGRTLELYTAAGTLNGSRAVVGTVRPVSFSADDDHGLDVFLPAAQAAWTSAVVFVRGGLPVTAVSQTIRDAVRAVDPSIAVHDFAALAAPLKRSLGVELFVERALIAFGLTGLLLSALGMYASASQAVVRSRRELGVRLALGASASRVGVFVVGRAVPIVVAGAGAGLVTAGWAATALTSLLHGLPARDGLALAIGPAVTCAVILTAVALPAWRAMNTDPLVALRADS